MTDQEIDSFLKTSWMDKDCVKLAKELGWITGSGKPDNNRVRNRLLGLGISLRPVETEYFRRIDSSFKAYLLGFILGDGGVDSSGSGFIIGVKRSDRYLLQQFQDELRNNGIICSIRDYDKTNSSQLIVRSKSEVRNLGLLGIKASKSLRSTADVKLPIGFEYEFLRGFMDADGCIPNNHNDGTLTICFMASKPSSEVLSTIGEFLSRQGFRVIRRSERLEKLVLHASYAKHLGLKMYSCGGPCLLRKKKVFQERVGARDFTPDWFEIGLAYRKGAFNGLNCKQISEQLGIPHGTLLQGMVREFGYKTDRSAVALENIKSRIRDCKGRFQ